MESIPLYATWWLWIAAALGLAILETLAPGFVFLGFAIGVALVGLLLLIPSVTGWSLPLLLLIAALLSLVAWFILRRSFALRGSAPKTFDHDIND
ncbi:MULTISPECIES: NfeD family protein [Shimia]|uniref:NfeD family protein n=1 Tax=Shimia TaxID=573139 RepID=UPI001FB487C6|nr:MULTISPECIES: hypothetical protein [Shimia]MDV4143976.1 hypothetical protein [Shimia sp. FJ5]